MKLARRYVEKPWGRMQVPPMFDAPEGQRIGEVTSAPVESMVRLGALASQTYLVLVAGSV